MRARWRALFCCSLASLIGLAWLADSLDVSLASWMNPQQIGMIAVAAIGFGGMVTKTRSRWPAGVALLCATPMGLGLYHTLSFLPGFIQTTHVPGVLLIFGAFSAIAVAVYTLVVPSPPLPDASVPRARQV